MSRRLHGFTTWESELLRDDPQLAAIVRELEKQNRGLQRIAVAQERILHQLQADLREAEMGGEAGARTSYLQFLIAELERARGRDAVPAASESSLEQRLVAVEAALARLADFIEVEELA